MSEQINLEPLREWFFQEKRDFPWREQVSAYAVWISEVMLQQTQALRVIPFFENWMRLFPTIEELAKAPLEKVLKAWEGLGYYSRARSLHAAANQILQEYNGRLPEDPELLQKIKGLGPYTIGAIRAFGFHKKAAAVDANVVRVLCRLFAIQDDISQAKTLVKLRQLAEKILPEVKPWVISEAFIELGALICTKKPKCLVCPLQEQCKSFSQNTQDLLPVKSNRVQYTALFREVAVIFSQDKVLLCKNGPGKIMAGLHEFPYFECQEMGWQELQCCQMLDQQYGLQVSHIESLNVVRQSFTRFRVKLFPKIFSTQNPKPVDGYFWSPLDDLSEMSFSSGHKKILESVQSNPHFSQFV